MKILAKAATPKKERKKAERTEEQQKELTERLAKMREKSLESRAAKKKDTGEKKPEISKALELAKGSSETPREDVFEKKYGSTLERITEVLSRVDMNMTDIKESKRLKAEARQKEKDDLAAAEALKKPAFEPATPKMATDMPAPSPYEYIPLTPARSSIAPAPVTLSRSSYVSAPLPVGGYKFGDFKKMSFGKKK